MDTIYKRCENDETKKKIGDILADNINMVQTFEIAALRDNQTLTFKSSENTTTAEAIKIKYGSPLKEQCKNSSKSTQMTAELSQKIGSLGESFSGSLKDWKRGWSLLTGVASDYSAVEKRLLKKELGKQ